MLFQLFIYPLTKSRVLNLHTHTRTHTHTLFFFTHDKEKAKQTDRQRQKDKQTDRLTDRQKYIKGYEGEALINE